MRVLKVLYAPRIGCDFDAFVLWINLDSAVYFLAVVLIILPEIGLAIRKALLVVFLEIGFDSVRCASLTFNPPDIGARHACVRGRVSWREVAVLTPSTGVIVGKAELSRLVDVLDHAGGWSVSMARDNDTARLPTCLAHFESSISTAASA